MSDQTVKVRLKPGQHLSLPGEVASVHLVPGQEVELAAAEATELQAQGVVEPVPKRGLVKRKKAAGG